MDVLAQIPYLSTEEVIERQVERLVNRLDKEFLSAKTRMTDWEYEERLHKIDQWAKIQLKRRK